MSEENTSGGSETLNFNPSHDPKQIPGTLPGPTNGPPISPEPKECQIMTANRDANMVQQHFLLRKISILSGKITIFDTSTSIFGAKRLVALGWAPPQTCWRWWPATGRCRPFCLGWQCKSVWDEGKLDGSFRKLEGHLVELIGKQMIIVENTHTHNKRTKLEAAALAIPQVHCPVIKHGWRIHHVRWFSQLATFDDTEKS